MKKLILTALAAIAAVTLFTTASTTRATEIVNTKATCDFELPIAGTTGYGVIDLNMRADDSSQSSSLGTVAAGQPFTILGEGNSYFLAKLEDGTTGWLSKTYTLVNLPDLIPSIRYNATNAYDSRFQSSNTALPGVTGQSLYTGKTYNARLGEDSFNMPVLYGMAKKIASAQALALSQGYTLVLYEGYRPYAVQEKVCSTLRELMATNLTVGNAIRNSGWNLNWFISTSVSNHQKGYAIDVSLACVTETQTAYLDNGQYILTIPTEYEEFYMPTPIHELSPQSATFQYPVNSNSYTAWKSTPLADSMTWGAKTLQDICTNSGLTPLSSEWWHFNDLDSRLSAQSAGKGNFFIEGNLSLCPSELG